MLIMSTCRVKEHNKHYMEDFRQAKQSWIYGIWHNNVLISVWMLRLQDTTAMVSNSKDGEIIARAIRLLGNPIIRGSTSKGAYQAALQALKTLETNSSIAITPDGPRGPKYQLNEGLLFLAALSKSPIIPFHMECSKQWEFKTWDATKLPKPFSTIHLCYGQPINVDRQQLESKMDKEATRQRIEEAMMENVAWAINLARENKNS